MTRNPRFILIIAILWSVSTMAIGVTAYVNVTTVEAKEMPDNDPSMFLLDVRLPIEYMSGHIPGAINIQHDTLALNLEQLPSNKSASILVYCRTGARSAAAADILENQLDFTNVTNMLGGITDWIAQGYPVTTGTESYYTLSSAETTVSIETETTPILSTTWMFPIGSFLLIGLILFLKRLKG